MDHWPLAMVRASTSCVHSRPSCLRCCNELGRVPPRRGHSRCTALAPFHDGPSLTRSYDIHPQATLAVDLAALASLPGPKDTIGARDPWPTARCRWHNRAHVDDFQLRALLPGDVQNQQLGRHGGDPAIHRDTDRCVLGADTASVVRCHHAKHQPNPRPSWPDKGLPDHRLLHAHTDCQTAATAPATAPAPAPDRASAPYHRLSAATSAACTRLRWAVVAKRFLANRTTNALAVSAPARQSVPRSRSRWNG